MRNRQTLQNMTILTSLLFLFAGCNTDNVVVTPAENKDFSVINGNTIKTEIFTEFQQIKAQDPVSKNFAMLGDTVVIYHQPKLNTVSATAPDLKNLKNNADGTPLRMVAIGGSLTAGVRDGGYFNEGIMTSYPNLIARQMQIQFNQPYFDDNSYNGFGRKTPTANNPTGSPIQKFNTVKNNLGIESVSATDIKLKKYKGVEIDNYAVPYLDRQALGSVTVQEYLSRGSIANDVGLPLRKEALSRILSNNENYTAKITSQNFDIITLEIRTTEVLNNMMGGLSTIGSPVEEKMVAKTPPYELDFIGLTGELNLLRLLEEKGRKKGILLNIPDFTTLPYFNSITNDMIKAVGLEKRLYSTNEIRLLPNSRLDTLLSPKIDQLLKILDANHPLTRNDMFYVSGYQTTIQKYNNEISLLSQRFNYPIVDINGLYDKIIKNNYVSVDGLKITSQDFFSTDGIYPSAIGQACIANEVIKVINATYKTTIPLINIKEFKK